MRAPVFLMLLALPLAGCDKLTGAADQKIADAEAIGYACRVSQKTPEACMKENEAQSPSSILDGWRSADKDIKEKAIDVGMSGEPAAAAEGESPVEGDKPAEGDKPVEEKKDEKTGEAAKQDKAEPTKEEKPKAEEKAGH